MTPPHENTWWCWNPLTHPGIFVTKAGTVHEQPYCPLCLFPPHVTPVTEQILDARVQ